MSNPQHIHDALKALKPSSRTFHDDEAPGNAVTPWIVGSLAMPEPRPNLVGGSHGGVARWWVTISGATAGQARVVAAEAVAAWSGKRVTVAGYSPFTVVHRTATGPYPAGLTATDTDLRFQVIRLGFDLVTSQTSVA